MFLLTLGAVQIVTLLSVASVSGLFIIIIVVATLWVCRCKKKHLGETHCYDLHFFLLHFFQYFFYNISKKITIPWFLSSNLPPDSDANDLTVYADISEITNQDVSILNKLWRFDFLCLLFYTLFMSFLWLRLCHQRYHVRCMKPLIAEPSQRCQG